MKKNKTIQKEYIWPVAVLALLFIFNFIFTDNFFTMEVRDGKLFGSIIDILDRAAPLILVAIGMTLVIATGGVDLSVGAIMAISGAVCACLIAIPESSILSKININDSFMAAAAIAVLLSCFLGAVNGLLIVMFDIQPIVATLILMVAGRGIAQLLTDGQIINFQNASFAFLGNGYYFYLPVSIILVFILFVISTILIRKTAAGLFIESAGNNALAAKYAGVPVNFSKLSVYIFSGLCSGLAGLLAAADIKAADANNAGLYIELDAILAAVLGGTALTGGRFFLGGTIIGAVLIQSVTTTILTKGIRVEYTLVVKAIVIVVICLLQAESFRRLFINLFRKIKSKNPAPALKGGQK